MSRVQVGVIALALSFAAAGCKDEVPKIDPKLKPFDESMKMARAPDAGSPAAGEKVDDGKPRVTLKWTVAKDKPLVVSAKMGSGGGGALDPAKLAQGPALDSNAIEAAIAGSVSSPAMTAVLANEVEGSYAVRVRADAASKDAKGAFGAGVAALKSEGKIRADMTARGFITTDLERNVRNVLALVLELPPDPVAVGDKWRSSVKLVSVGDDFNRVDSNNKNEVRLASIEQDKNGGEVAVIDYFIAEHQKGFVGIGKTQKDATASAAFVGRGKFLVSEGRWLSLEGRLVSAQGGGLSGGSDERLSLLVGGAPPQDLLEDPAPKSVVAPQEEDSEGDGTQPKSGKDKKKGR